MPEILTKLPDWRARLDLFVGASTRRPFEWGVHDCALFAAEGVDAQTGSDFAAEFRGRYSTFEEGLKLIQEAGYDDHVALAAASLIEIPPAFARIGDVAAVEFGTTDLTLMIVAGHRLIGPMPGMRGSVPLTSAVRAFAVGWQP